jgi:hypothetical protein
LQKILNFFGHKCNDFLKKKKLDFFTWFKQVAKKIRTLKKFLFKFFYQPNLVELVMDIATLATPQY